MAQDLHAPLGFGKYKDRTWAELAQTDRDYLERLAKDKRRKDGDREAALAALGLGARSQPAPAAAPAPAPADGPAAPAAEPAVPKRVFRIRLKPIPRESHSTELNRGLNWKGKTVNLSQANRVGRKHDPELETVLKTEDEDLAYYLLGKPEYEEVGGAPAA